MGLNGLLSVNSIATKIMQIKISMLLNKDRINSRIKLTFIVLYFFKEIHLYNYGSGMTPVEIF